MLTILLGRARSWSIAHPGTLSKPGHVAVWLTSHVKFSWRSWQSEDGGISIHTNFHVFTGRSGWIVVLANGTCHDLVDSLGSSWIVVASTLHRSRSFKRWLTKSESSSLHFWPPPLSHLPYPLHEARNQRQRPRGEFLCLHPVNHCCLGIWCLQNGELSHG